MISSDLKSLEFQFLKESLLGKHSQELGFFDLEGVVADSVNYLVILVLLHQLWL